MSATYIISSIFFLLIIILLLLSARQTYIDLLKEIDKYERHD